MARIPANHPRSQTGIAIIDWICDGEKFGIVYPDDYTVNGAPATMEIDLSQTYSLVVDTIVPSKGYIHQAGTGDLVNAVEITPAVAARLSSGGGVSTQEIDAMLTDWLAGTLPPRQKMLLDIQNLIDNGKVDI